MFSKTIIPFLDYLAHRWLVFSMHYMIRNSPEFEEFRLKEMEYKNNTIDFVFEFPRVALIAEECAKLLKVQGAENSVQLRMAVAGLYKEVLLTVQWADGKSPNEMVAEVKEELKLCKQRLTDTGM